MTGRCETCRYWQRLDYANRRSEWLDEANEAGEWGTCVLIGYGDEYPGVPPDRKPKSPRAFTLDGSDYWSGLNTRADFGCVEHEPLLEEEQ